MNRFRQFLESEKKKILELEGKSRYQYIWQYYKLWIIAFCCLVFMIGYVGHHVRNTLSDHWFYITFVSTWADVGNGSELWDGYVDYSGYDTSEKLIDFNNESYFDYTKNHAQGNTYYELCVAHIESATLDAITMKTEEIVLFGETGRFLDLDSEECQSIKEKYGDRFVYCTPLDEEYESDHVAVGIDITDSILMEKYHLYEEGSTCALAIGEYSQHLEAVEKFLDYIFEEE